MMRDIPDTLHATQDALRRTFQTLDTLRSALRESVKLQSHYAGLLNDYDGGKRRQFVSAEEWIARLASMKAPKGADHA